jgi:hypothetical protein
MFVESSDDEQIIERVAALDVGKAEVVCCMRLPPLTVHAEPYRRVWRLDSLEG